MTDVLTIAVGVFVGVLCAAPVASLLVAAMWVVIDEAVFGRD
ncbi:hypothetical protein [Halostella litorea]|nr:hypothetical protein [Halostella litorea]